MKININSWHYKLCKKLDCIFGAGIKKLTRNDKDSFLSVAIGYAKAKKQKVCPIIEYTDGE